MQKVRAKRYEVMQEVCESLELVGMTLRGVWIYIENSMIIAPAYTGDTGFISAGASFRKLAKARKADHTLELLRNTKAQGVNPTSTTLAADDRC